MKFRLILCIIGIFLIVSTEAFPILITEVFYDTPGTDSDEEWLELYNPTSSDIDVAGYVIEDNTTTYNYTIENPDNLSNPVIIGTGEVLVIARDKGGFNNLYGFDPDLDNFNLSLANDGGDFLILKDTGGTLVDKVGWENYEDTYDFSDWNISADEDYSLKRISFGSGPSAWAGNQTPDPGSPAPLPEPGTLILLSSGLIGLAGILHRRRRQREVD